MWLSAASQYAEQSDSTTEIVSGMKALTQSSSIKSHPLNNVLFLYCSFGLRDSWWLFFDGSWKAEADELNISHEAIQFLIPPFFPLKPNWPHTGHCDLWTPYQSPSVSDRSWTGQPTDVHSPVNKGSLCKRDKLWIEILSVEKVLNSSSVFQQHVQDCCHYKTVKLHPKTFSACDLNTHLH